MKAKEVARKITSSTNIDEFDSILADFASELVRSIPDIAEQRKARSGPAINSIIDEVCDRWKAMRNQCVKINPTLNWSKAINENAIMDLLQLKYPVIYQTYQEVKRHEEVHRRIHRL